MALLTNQFLTIRDVAEIFQVTARTVTAWNSTTPPRIPYIKIGGSVRFRLEDVLEAAYSNRIGSDRAATNFNQTLFGLVRDEVQRQLNQRR